MFITAPPDWFNAHGFRVYLGGNPIYHPTYENEVLAGSKTSQIQIRPSLEKGKYKVLWLLIFSEKDFVHGEITLPAHEVRDAFCVCQNILESKVQGHYIRRGRFLNIPMSGTGADGDPNISIFVSDEIREAATRLVGIKD